jgi:hypothetical protein
MSLALLCILAPLAGCNCSCDTELVAAERSRLLLDAEPPDAQGVLDLRESLADEERRVVVVGRIGGGQPVFDPDHALFLIVDPSVPQGHHHPDGCDENCPFCAKGAEEQTVAYVHCVDASGQSVPTRADRLLGLAVGQTVVISGWARCDAAGNLVIRANGVYIRG